MSFEEKLDAAIEKDFASDIRKGTGLELDPDSIGWCKYWADWARQETLKEVAADVQEMKNILEYGETGILTSLHLRIKLLLKKLESEK